MKHKTLISAILVIVVIIIGFLIIRKKPALLPVDTVPVATVPSGNTSSVEPTTTSIDEDSYLAGVSGDYPTFPQADPVFNKKIADFVTAGVASFKEDANANYKAQLQTGGTDLQRKFANGAPYTYQVKPEIIQSNNDYISLLVHVAGFSGGAHGYATTTSFNYDVKNKKEITLSDLFPNNPNYLKTISDESRKQLKPRLAKASEQTTLDPFIKSMITDGTDPTKPENFLVYTFTNDVVTIYYGQYQVAPYVYGEQSIDIPRK